MAFSCATRALWWVAACALAAHGKEPVELKVQKSMIIYFCALADIPELVGNGPTPYCNTMKKEGEVLRFRENNVTRVEYRATGDEVIDLEPGALDRLVDLRALRLDRVKIEKLPQNLDELTLIKTGVTEVPPEVINVEELKLEEDKITEIVGVVPRCRNLVLNTPRLKTLRLHQVRIDTMRGFALNKSHLYEVELTMVTGPLPEGFLRGEKTLRRFTISNSDLTSIPWDLFYHTPLLEFIDLSSNKISSLTKWQFGGLAKLKTLWLVDNKLRISAMASLGNHAKLTSLGLTGNPLGDLCVNGGPSKLQSLPNLENLHLMNTGGRHLCKDWVTERPRLALLNFQNNGLTHLNCDDLRLVRDESVGRPTLDLTGNPITVVNCSRANYDDAFHNQNQVLKERKLRMDASLACSCGWSWLERTLPYLRIDLVRPDRRSPCSDDQLEAYRDC